jgi:UDP-GlcNAc:undecaprenyl-phosphate GlcNAc-1-phosphate transferase
MTTAATIVVLAKLAPHLGLQDQPSLRKLHSGAIPLVGGLAIMTSLIIGTLIWDSIDTPLTSAHSQEGSWEFLVCALLLTLTGAIDDRFELRALTKLASEITIAVLVVYLLNLKVVNLGNLLGTGNLRLGPGVAYIFTVIAIIGVINAFNMLDGMDGLLASLVLSTLLSFHVLTGTNLSFVVTYIGAALLAFLISNLRLTPCLPKTFLGDAGSRLLGFLVVCLLIAAASDQVGAPKIIKPVTALYLIALPLFDMVFIALRRVSRGESPFTADRTHIHHLMQAAGFSPQKSLWILLVLSSSFNVLGLIMHRSATPEHWQFVIFINMFVLYFVLINWLWANKAVKVN